MIAGRHGLLLSQRQLHSRPQFLDQPDGSVAVVFKDRAEIPSAAEMEDRYDHRKHPNALVRAVK